MQVAAVSEDELLAIIIPRLSQGPAVELGPGDDAAVLSAPDGRLVVSTDVLVQDRHFDLRWGTSADLGYRSAMQNLADIAAMGARPTAVVVALVLPGHLEVDWVAGLAEGFAQACGPHRVGVVGGDLAAGEQVVVAVTAHGTLDGGRAVLRDGARPGDVLAVSGVLGRARAGLSLLQADPGAGGELVRAFLRPEPPLAAGPAARHAGATALLDVSDGLVRDAGRIATASGVSISVDTGRLQADLTAVEPAAEAGGSQALEWVLSGGEDHALLATFAPEAGLPAGFRVIGAVQEPTGSGPGVLVDGYRPAGRTGWDHFAG
ncbi:MAG TPA: thiamine-phosphate kinase [Beutenbergiaceae bacterium]|nr:thiamine-phosphate kinase [Beutenbergiaceae bacterium]